MVVGEEKPVFKIRSSDGQEFDVEDWFIEKSKSFSVVFSHMKDLSRPFQTTVSSFILGKIIQWCYHHRHDSPNEMYRMIPAWDAHFLQINNGILLLLIEAAFRLDIVGLLDIACRAVSNMIGRPLNDVKLMLRVGGYDDEFDVEENLEEEDEGDAERVPAISAA